MARATAVRDAPPSRYRVVERGRRLEVIDTRAPGAPNLPSDPRRQRLPLAASLPRRTRFDGSATLTTSVLYDEKGPRTIALDPTSARIVRWAQIGAILLVAAYVIGAVFALWMLVAIPVFFDKRIWKPLRGRTTAWLDKVEREAS